jgi:hypothetical protein
MKKEATYARLYDIDIVNKRIAVRLRGSSSDVEAGSLGLANTPAVTFGGFLVITVAFHIPNQTLFFTEFFEPSNHLLYRFACPGLNFQHLQNFLSINIFNRNFKSPKIHKPSF